MALRHWGSITGNSGFWCFSTSTGWYHILQFTSYAWVPALGWIGSLLWVISCGCWCGHCMIFTQAPRGRHQAEAVGVGSIHRKSVMRHHKTRGEYEVTSLLHLFPLPRAKREQGGNNSSSNQDSLSENMQPILLLLAFLLLPRTDAGEWSSPPSGTQPHPIGLLPFLHIPDPSIYQECSELQLPLYQDPPGVMLDKLSAGMAEQKAVLKKNQWVLSPLQSPPLSPGEWDFPRSKWQRMGN